MIITKESDKQAELATVAIPHDDIVDSPPPYVQRAIIPNAPLPPTPSADPSGSGSGLAVDPLHQLPDIPASNYVYISKRDGSIRQSFVLDTSLDVPQDLSAIPPQPPKKSSSFLNWTNEKEDPFAVDENAPRPHLKLQSKDGTINTNIWLVNSEDGRVDPMRQQQQAGGAKGKAILDVGTKDGPVNVKLHSLTEQNFSLRAWSKDGSITVYIPSSFVGPVNIYTGDGAVVPSAGVSKRLITFSQHNKSRKCFMGDFKSAGYTDAASWNGSTLDLITKDGSIRLFFIEELSSTKSKGFMSKLFASLMNV